MTTQEAISGVGYTLTLIAEELNKLTQEVIKLNERIEDATTIRAGRGES